MSWRIGNYAQQSRKYESPWRKKNLSMGSTKRADRCWRVWHSKKSCNFPCQDSSMITFAFFNVFENFCFWNSTISIESEHVRVPFKTKQNSILLHCWLHAWQVKSAYFPRHIPWSHVFWIAVGRCAKIFGTKELGRARERGAKFKNGRDREWGF